MRHQYDRIIDGDIENKYIRGEKVLHIKGIYGSLFAAFLLLILPVTEVFAEKSMDDVEKERDEIKDKLSDAENEVADIIIEIDEIEEEMAELDSVLKENKNQVKETEKDIDEVQNEIDELEKKIEERFEILKDRAKSYQENGGNSRFIDVLFDSEDFSDFISRASAISKITDADSKLIEEQKRDKEKVEEKLDTLEDMKSELENKQEQLKEQKEVKEKADKDLKSKKEDLNNKVDKLEMEDNDLSDLESKLKREKEAKDEAEKQAQSESSSDDSTVAYSKDTGGGEYAWPTEGGYISSTQGQRWGREHKGVDIARTDRSTSPPIYAAESGTVKSAGTMNGYGNTVVIDHGNGMETLYGHMSSIKASTGQKVERGQQIGVMGSTGNSTGIHLHFEVHKNGEIMNPLGYIN